MGDNRRGKYNLVRSAAIAACAGLVAAAGACSGDDTAAPPAGNDGSVSDSASSSSSSSSGGSSSGRSGSSSSSSGGSSSSSSSSGSSSGSSSSSSGAGDASSDAPKDSSGMDSTLSEGGGDSGDATADAWRPPTPLQYCPWLDFVWQIGPDPEAGAPDGAVDGGSCATQTTSSCPDRAGNWEGSISTDFLIILTADCRIGDRIQSSLTQNQVNDYGNQVSAFTLAFFGCPSPSADAGAVAYGLIPSPEVGTPFTTADLHALSDDFIAGINQAFSDNQSFNGGPGSLDTNQTNQVMAQLQALAGSVPGTVSSNNYSQSTCMSDAGDGGGG